MKKQIVKSYLEGLDEDEISKNLASKGIELDRAALRSSIEEFESGIQKSGVEKAGEALGVSRVANELGEVAKFKRKNGIELEEMLQGAKVARVLKSYRVGIPELDVFISTAYSRASREKLTPEALVAQISSLEVLEKKYDVSFDELKSQYEALGKDIKTKLAEKGSIEEQIDELKKQKTELLAQNKVDEARLEEFQSTRETLHSMGLDPDDLDSVKTFLLALKGQNFDPAIVISRINHIEDLQKEKSFLEQETRAANDELHWKRALLAELKNLQETNMSVQQVDAIQKIVVRIAADRGIEKSSAYSQFHEDIVKNYDSVLGLSSVITKLQREQNDIEQQAAKRARELEEEEAKHNEKLKKIENMYSKISSQIEDYNKLAEIGVDAKTIQRWKEVIESSGLDPASVELQLKQYSNLQDSERKIMDEIEILKAQAASLNENVATLEREKKSIESSIKTMNDAALSQIDSASSKIAFSISALNEDAKSKLTQLSEESQRALNYQRASFEQDTRKMLEQSGENLKATVSKLGSSVEEFATRMKNVIDEATPQLKTVSAALEAGEQLGKYKNILPLLELMDEKNVSESQALIAMWNVSNRFKAWVAEHYKSKPDISATVSKLVDQINEEMQKSTQMA